MRIFALLLPGTLLAATGVARADGDAAPADPAPVAATAVSPDGPDQLTVPKGRAILNAFVEVSLDSGAVGKPISLSPDIWYGVSDDLSVGLIHSTFGQTGLIGDVGDSLCLTGTNNGCRALYDNVGLDARYGVAKGANPLAIEGGLVFPSLGLADGDVFLAKLKLGLVGRHHAGKIAIEFEPEVFIALNKRSADPNAAVSVVQNDVFGVPVAFIVEAAPKINLVVQTGVFSSFQHFSDDLSIPLTIGANIRVAPQFDLLLAFTFPEFLANTTDQAGNSSFGTQTDFRTITAGGSYAF